MIITVWERLNFKTNKWEHNHISEGYSETEVIPIPTSRIQERSWPKGLWRKVKGYLENQKVTHFATEV